MRDVRGAALVEVARRSEDVKRLGVLLAEALLALEVADLERVGRGVVLTRELDRADRALRCVRVDERVLGARGEELPLGARVDALERLGDLLLELLDFAELNLALLVVDLASRLNVLGDVLLKGGLLLLEADDGGLKVVCEGGAGVSISATSRVQGPRSVTSVDSLSLRTCFLSWFSTRWCERYGSFCGSI